MQKSINNVSPISGALDAAALEPSLLDPVYEILLVGVVPVVHDERLEAVCGLVLDPVLEDEAEDAGRHLQEEEDGQEDGVGGQQRRVLPQRPHAPREPDDEGDGARPDEDEGGVEGDVGHEREVVEGVLLGPRPHADRQYAEADQPEDDVEAEDDVLEAARDLAVVPPVAAAATAAAVAAATVVAPRGRLGAVVAPVVAVGRRVLARHPGTGKIELHCSFQGPSFIQQKLSIIHELLYKCFQLVSIDEN